MKYVTSIDGQEFVIEINREGEVIVDGTPHEVNLQSMDGRALHSLLIDKHSHEALIERHRDEYHVLMYGHMYTVHVADEREQHLGRASFVPPSGELSIGAPMPGLISEISIEEGQEVQAGETLLILESMKMGNEIKAPRDGAIHRLCVEVGDSVEQNQTLVVLS